jgi:hypothetical protein
VLEGKRKYSPYSFLTSALEGSEWSASSPGCTLPPGKGHLVPNGQGAWWAPEPVWTQRLQEMYRNVQVKIYRTIILPVVLYGCETWSLILREEHRLRVFENRVLRRIFGPKGMK